MGISDNTQAIIVLISSIFMGIGVIAIPSSIPYHDIIAAVFWIIGIIGMVTKEKLGTLISGNSTQNTSSNLVDPFANQVEI